MGPHPHDLYLATAGRSAVLAAVICSVKHPEIKNTQKQKTPPVVAGQWMLGV